MIQFRFCEVHEQSAQQRKPRPAFLTFEPRADQSRSDFLALAARHFFLTRKEPNFIVN